MRTSDGTGKAGNPVRSVRVPIAVAIGASVLVGCVSNVRLAHEREVEPYASLLCRSESVSHELATVCVQPECGPAVRVALEAVGFERPEPGPILVLQPGILADGSTWRFLVGALAADHDLLVVDPPGTGRSDKPDPDRAGPSAYAPSWLAEHTLLAVDAWRARNAPHRDLVVVGHSLGSTVALRMLADPRLRARHADLVGRIRGAVLLAPADEAMETVDPRATEITEVGDLEARLGCALGVVRTTVERGVWDNTVRPERDAIAEDADRITGIVCRGPSRRAAQAMLLRFRPQDARMRPIRSGVDRLVAEERAITTPILILWGERDDTLPISQAPLLLARLPSARMEVVPDAKHSIQQERAEEVAQRIRGFLATLGPAGGWTTSPGRVVRRPTSS